MTLPAMRNSPETDDTLSALIDGELADDLVMTALRRLAASNGERARFIEYCAVGDALRGMHAVNPDFTQQVMAALENEPTVLAPMRKPLDRRPALWLAAATVAAISWGLWQSDPRQQIVAPMAATTPVPAGDAMAYLAAHQDFAQAVMSEPEMRYTRVMLTEDAR